MAKKNMLYAVRFMLGNEPHAVMAIEKFCDAKKFAERNNGQVFLHDVESGIITDRIWPKEQPTFTWGDLNNAFLYASGIKKAPQPKYFEYTVYCGDYDIGGFTWTIEYHGKDRDKALHAYKEAKAWLGQAYAEVELIK